MKERLERVQVLLPAQQRAALAEIARQEARGVSEVARDLIAEALRLRERQRWAAAAEEAVDDYLYNPEFADWRALDGEPFYGDDPDAEG